MYGLIGKKVKMTQIFNDNGHVVPVTLVEAGPCTVSQIKEEKNNGYNAIQLAYGKKSKNNTNKPTLGHLSKSGLETAKVLAEFKSIDDLDQQSIIRQFIVNALSPLTLTKSLKSLLKRSSKIAFITSRMGSIGDNSSGSSYGYRMSKVALSMAAKSLSRDLLKEEIYVAILHPGLVSTRMTGFTKFGISTEESANGLLKRIDSLNKNNTGTFWHTNGEILPW